MFSPDGVSTGYLMKELALQLRGLGHDVTVLTTTPHNNLDPIAAAAQPILQRYWLGQLQYSECDGIPVWHVKLPWKGQRLWLRALDFVRFHVVSLAANLRKTGRQDIVISTSPPLTIGVISWLLAARWGAPSVYKVAELYPDLAIRQGVVRGRLLIAFFKWLERFVYARNAAIVAIADQFGHVISARGVSDAKLHVISDFVDTDLYRPLPRDNEFAVANGLVDPFVVLYGGNIGRVQDWKSVLGAAERLSALPIRFVIVGGGARRAWLHDEVRARNLNNVTLMEYQPSEMMPTINASCDIGIIPMTKVGALDGFPSKVYTILASAKPVLASTGRDSEMAELLREAQCGRIVEPEDPEAYAHAVKRAFDDRRDLPREGQRGRTFVEAHYSKQAIGRQYDRLIRGLTPQRHY